jgi:hypothetical protein
MDELSAGQRLRAGVIEALAVAARQSGEALEFDEREVFCIESAVIAADRAERRARLAQEFDGRASADALTKLSAEARMNEKQAVDLAVRVQIGLGAAKSPRHQHAAQARWNRSPAVR